MRAVTAAPTGATTLPTNPHSSPSTTIADPYSGSLMAPNASSTSPLAGQAYSTSVRPLSPRSAEISTLPGRPPASSSPVKDTLIQKHWNTGSQHQQPPTLAHTCLTQETLLARLIALMMHLLDIARPLNRIYRLICNPQHGSRHRRRRPTHPHGLHRRISPTDR
jgi:hypothetical protein